MSHEDKQQVEDLVGRVFDETAMTVTPAQLERMATRAARTPRRRGPPWPWLAAAAIAATLVVALLFASRSELSPPTTEIAKAERVDPGVSPPGATESENSEEEESLESAVAIYLDVGWSDEDTLHLELLDDYRTPPTE